MFSFPISAAILVGCAFFAVIAVAQPVQLQVGDGSQWHFPAGQWTQNDRPVENVALTNMHSVAFLEEGVIIPPDQKNLYSRAFHKANAYGDAVVEFDYNPNYRENGAGHAGLILRAADPNHFYYIYFPWGAQQLRAKHYWAAIAKIEGDGYLRNLQMSYVPGIPSEVNRWFHVKVEATGPRIRVWVDGRSALDVTDDTYKSGLVGLAGYGMYYFRNLHVTGAASPAPQWDDSATIPAHAFSIGLSSGEMPTTCIAPNGDVLMGSGDLIARSTDKGRTWSTPAAATGLAGVTLSDYGASMFRSSKDRLIIMTCSVAAPGGKANVQLYESTDSGVTWSGPVGAAVADEGWPAEPAKLTTYGPLVETDDGTLLRFLYSGVQKPAGFESIHTWSALNYKGYVIRSTDGGNSWSGPIDLDWPTWHDMARGSVPGALDLTEPTGVAMGNVVTVLVRPVYSPQMWQCWSNDAGATWDAATRATFPGYAQAMTRTKSGAILCGHRYPGYTVNVSRDGGLNWDAGTLIDNANWAMGTMTEVEEDVVLATYMNAYRDQPLLLQRFRVTKDRLEPLPADR